MSVVRVASMAAVAVCSLGCAEAVAPSYGTPPGVGGAQSPSMVWGVHGLASADRAVAFVQSRLGTPYCWGGAGPRCYDCSGLTRAAWLAGGKRIPRSSDAQAAKLTPVPLDAVQPGDILWRPGHVGLYVGKGWVIAATHSGDVVRYQKAAGYQRAVRP